MQIVVQKKHDQIILQLLLRFSSKRATDSRMLQERGIQLQ
jgi:hypothetical protein